jgi:hypothetical protein
MLSKYEKYRLVYSPRTSISNMREREEKLFNDLGIGFEPSTIEIMKKHFKERLGVINKVTFISIIKRHLNKWHPDLCNREEILVKLLSKLFDQIDLNSNGDMEWNEFMNYIVDSSFQKNFQKASNTLQHYAICKTNLALSSVPGEEVDRNNLLSNFNQSVSYCFYIQKYKLIGVVHDNKSSIIFYNAETNKKEGKEINLIETQDEIDKFEINELDHKTKIMLQKESEKFKQLFLKQKENIISFRKKNNIKGAINLYKQEKQLNQLTNKELFKSKEKERIPTPSTISREIRLIKGSNFLNNKKRNLNRKLSTLSTFFVEEYDLLFISSSNNKISAWRYYTELNGFKNVNSSNYQSKYFVFSETEMKIPIFSSYIPQYTLCFDSIMNKLYSGQEDGKILLWSMQSSKHKGILFQEDTKSNNNKSQIKKSDFENNILFDRKSSNESNILNLGNDITNKENEAIGRDNKNKQFLNVCNKRDTVSCLLMLNKLRLLCSSYYNGKIILWDIVTRKPKKIFNEQKTGIYQFVYDPFKNYLYTCGFDHNIYVYDPYNDESSIYQLKGHNASVKSLSLNLENNELISIDINGNLKIWDTTCFMNFQTLNIYNSLIAEQGHSKKQAEQMVNKKKIMSNIHVLSLSNIKKIIVYGDKFLTYEKGKTKNPNLCDDNLILGCIYNNFQNDLITFSNKRVKLWDIYTGKVKIIFEDPMEGGEITSFAHDIQMKRFYIGDNLGKIKNFNLSTGGYLKSFISHKTEITHMIHSFKFELLVTCSSDLVIRFQNDSELTTTEIIKEINLHFLFSSMSQIDHIYLKDVKLNEEDGQLMMGLSNTWISFYDVIHYKYLHLLNMPQEAISKTTSISCMEDIKNVNILFVSYENGKKSFLLKPNNKYYYILNFKKFGQFIEKDHSNYINKDNYRNDDYKGIGVSSLYDESTSKLIIGDHLGFINIYIIDILNEFMNKKFENDEEIINYALNEIKIESILLIKAHKESIKHISVPKDLRPEIILSTSNDRTVKLFNLYTGEFIDSLKQVSIKYNPVPIAIEYIKNNPFLKDVEEIEKKSKIELYDTESVLKFIEMNKLKNINKNNSSKEKNISNSQKIVDKKTGYPIPIVDTIFRENAKKNIRQPEFDADDIHNNDAFTVSNDILEYNAKLKLHDSSIGTNIPSYRSTFWNYNIDINYILNKNKEDIQELINKVNAKENEIVQTELAYKNSSIYNPNYQPIFLRNLDDDEKTELTDIINDKIKNIKFAISRSQISKCENESIKKIYHFNSPNTTTPSQSVFEEINKKKNNSSKKNSKIIQNKKFSSTVDGFGKKNIFNNRNLINKNNQVLAMRNTENNFNSKYSLKDKKCTSINNSKSQKFRLDTNYNNSFNDNPIRTTIGNENKKWIKKYNDVRIQKCLSQFEEKLNELARPFALLYHNKKIKKNALPKINYNIFTNYNIGK